MDCGQGPIMITALILLVLVKHQQGDHKGNKLDDS
jgi:hypothetical protein